MMKAGTARDVHATLSAGQHNHSSPYVLRPSVKTIINTLALGPYRRVQLRDISH